MKFKAHATVEPKQALKSGPLEAETTASGLRLRRGKELDFLVPIGTPVWYEKGNKLTVGLSNCRLTLVVNRFGSYQNRLTRDLAAFLTGHRTVPLEADYALPWYLYLPAVLPIGIPIMTLGGALPGALGFGLAAVCYSIVQNEDWPIIARIAVCLAIAAAGYGMIIAMGVAALLTGRPGTP